MAAILVGSLSGGVLAPGATLSYNQDGSISGTATYQFATTPSSQVGNSHPFNSAAKCFSYTLSYREGYVIAENQYAGVWSSSRTILEGLSSCSQDPIESHPDFTSSLAGTPAAPLNSAIFNTDGTFVGWPSTAGSNLGGVTTYLRPGLTVRYSSVITTIPTLTLIGTIVVLTQFTGSFLCTSVTFTQRDAGLGGSIYSMSIEYTFSPSPGWNSAIY